MRFWVLSALLAFVTTAAPAEGPATLVKVARSYIAAQEAVMEKGAGKRDVDRLMSFYAPGYTYYHPEFGAKVAGVDSVREGISSHLGETSNARIAIKGILTNGDMVSLALRESFTDLATGKRIARDRTTVLTIRAGKVVQRVDM